MNKFKLTLLLVACIQLAGCGGDSGGGDLLLAGGLAYVINEAITPPEDTTSTSTSSGSGSGTSGSGTSGSGTSGGGSYDWSYSCGYSGSGGTVPIPVGSCESQYKYYAQVFGCNDVANMNTAACNLQNCTGINMACGSY
ncbi:MAG TPA: hypothetical protein VGD24_02290 [Gallionella sp.]